MQIIVTGGAGFIGSNLVHELQRRQPDVWITVVDDFTSGDFHNLTGFAGDVVARPCEELDWKYYFGKREIIAIYHLASITDTTVTNQREMVERNVEGFRRVLRFARSRGLRVVYASSAATYGQEAGVMREDQPAAAANVYGFSKGVLDNLAAGFASEGLPVTGLRYFNVYGPREAHKGKMASMIYQLYLQMKGGQAPRIFRHGEQRRDFVYVKDAVAGTLLAGQSEEHGVYNVGSGETTSFNEVIAALNEALGTAFEPQYIENPYEAFYQTHTEADLTRVREALGYRPEWPFKTGVTDYVAWLESAGVAANCSSSPK